MRSLFAQEAYRLGRSVREEGLESVARALNYYLRVWHEEEPLHTFGRGSSTLHVNLMYQHSEDQGHFDLMIPVAEAWPPWAWAETKPRKLPITQ